MNYVNVDPAALHVLADKSARRANDTHRTSGPNTMAEKCDHQTDGYFKAMSQSPVMREFDAVMETYHQIVHTPMSWRRRSE